MVVALLAWLGGCAGESADPAGPGGGSTTSDVVWTSLTAGEGALFDYSCGLASDGAAYCWGEGRGGQLNGVSREDARAPLPAAPGLQLREINAGWQRTCGIDLAGVAWCWGNFLREDFTRYIAKPVVVGAGRKFAHIAAGNFDICGVDTDGVLLCWRDVSGEQRVLMPQVKFEAVTQGGWEQCGIAVGGDAYCWGYGAYAKPGSTTFPDSVLATAVPLPGGLKFSTLHVAFDHACGVTLSGDGYCWGNGARGALGAGGGPFLDNSSYVPQRVAGGLRFKSIAAASSHSCGLTTAGAAYCWGDNQLGQLGVTEMTGSYVPVAVSGGLTFTHLAAGGSQTCALTNEGVAYCWGLNSNGQLGDGSTRSLTPIADIHATPTRVVPPRQ